MYWDGLRLEIPSRSPQADIKVSTGPHSFLEVWGAIGSLALSIHSQADLSLARSPFLFCTSSARCVSDRSSLASAFVASHFPPRAAFLSPHRFAVSCVPFRSSLSISDIPDLSVHRCVVSFPHIYEFPHFSPLLTSNFLPLFIRELRGVNSSLCRFMGSWPRIPPFPPPTSQCVFLEKVCGVSVAGSVPWTSAKCSWLVVFK